MFKRSAPTRVAGGALAIVIAAMLTGCFANPLDSIMEKAGEEGAKNVAEDILKNATGGDVGIEFGELPADFPSEVTLVSENILHSVTVESGTSVVVSDSRSLKELTAQVKKDFTGWEEAYSTDLGEMVSLMYQKEEASLSVAVGIIQGSEGDDNSVSYTVIRTEE